MLAGRLGLCVSVLLILSTAACTSGSLGGPTPTPDPCSPGEIMQYLDAIRYVHFRFDDAVALASVTPQESLSVAIANLEAIRGEAEELEVPVCAVAAKEALGDYMDATIEAFTAILANQPAADANSALQRAAELREAYLDEMAEVTGQQ